VPIAVVHRPSFNGLSVSAEAATGTSTANDITLAGGGDLTATPGDHEITLDWDAVPGATSYTIEVTDPLASPTTYTVASGVTATTYTHSPEAYELGNAAAGWTGKGLVLGNGYVYTVTSNNAVELGPVTGRPDDGLSLSGWTSVNGSTRRDARNTGHLAVGSSFTTYTEDQYYSPGAVIEDAIFDGCRARFSSQGSYTFRRCWLQDGIWNQAGEGSISTVSFEDCTIGPPYGLGSNDDRYWNDAMMGGNGGKITMTRCMVIHGGSQVFLHIAGPSSITDSFFTGMYSPDFIVDPHMDCLWLSTSGPTSNSITVQRNHFEAAARGTSAVWGPDGATNGVFEDNLLNSLSASGTIAVNGGTYRRNRVKRYPTGGFMQISDGNAVKSVIGAASVWTDNTWIDLDGSVWEDGEAI
jgi:hypothetical protein